MLPRRPPFAHTGRRATARHKPANCHIVANRLKPAPSLQRKRKRTSRRDLKKKRKFRKQKVCALLRIGPRWRLCVEHRPAPVDSSATQQRLSRDRRDHKEDMPVCQAAAGDASGASPRNHQRVLPRANRAPFFEKVMAFIVSFVNCLPATVALQSPNYQRRPKKGIKTQQSVPKMPAAVVLPV